jgi:FdhD protein
MSSVKNFQVTKITATGKEEVPDLLAVEEPLEIRLGYGALDDRKQKNIAVTMRTPGHDIELAIGFLFTEGLIVEQKDIVSANYCEDVETEEEKGNVVRVELHPEIIFDLKKLERNFYTTSSCGVCGKSSIESITTQCRLEIHNDPDFKVSTEVIHQLPITLREEQAVFEHTGGLHATGLFDATGKLLMLREDVGRHNAFDKVIGASVEKASLPLDQSIVLVSGRLSFELVQKAAMAGVRILVAVGAPSSLAIDLAKSFQMTVIGFTRNDRFNIYSLPQRIYF